MQHVIEREAKTVELIAIQFAGPSMETSQIKRAKIKKKRGTENKVDDPMKR